MAGETSHQVDFGLITEPRKTIMAAEKNDTGDSTDGKKGPGLFGLIKAIAFVSVLVIVQVVAASFLIPTPRETQALAIDLAAASKGEEGTTAEDQAAEQIDEAEEIVEVEIGPFSVTRFNPETNMTTNIDFELFATVLAEENEDFTERFESNRNRVREQVILTLHGAKMTELTSPELGLIKRKILEKTNRALGKPMVREVMVTSFNFVER